MKRNVFNRDMVVRVSHPKHRAFCYEKPILRPLEIITPFYDLSKEDKQIAYSMAVDGFKPSYSLKPMSETVIKIKIKKTSTKHEETGCDSISYRLWLLPTKYTLAKMPRQIWYQNCIVNPAAANPDDEALITIVDLLGL